MPMHESRWRDGVPTSRRSARVPREVDVLVVGGGITGLTAAYLLARAGKRVAVVERERIGAGETGNTSAHLTQISDLPPTALVDRFGRDAARLVWEGGATAIDLIESIIEREGIDCGFSRVPGWVCAPFFDGDHRERELLADSELAASLGFHASYRQSGPIRQQPAFTVPDQALFHPLRYLHGLAEAAERLGVSIAEHAEMSEALQDPLVAIVNAENVACEHLLIATHVPIVGSARLVSAMLFQTKLYPYSSYVVSGYVDASLEPGLYEDLSSPYRYLRIHRDEGGTYAVFGGADHKTGTVTDTDRCFVQVENEARTLFPTIRVDARWTGQVIETADGLPFVGETAPHQYVATGFAGNGLTFGTLGALMMHDAVMGVANPWKDLFDPHRKELDAKVLAHVITENADYPFYFVADRLRRDRKSTVGSIRQGEGKVLTIGGKAVACHRTDEGTLIKVSAVCTHLGCLVRWNTGERTWDCPCHGSRFTPEGLVLGGPAEAALERMD